jgi:hypothetical protein
VHAYAEKNQFVLNNLCGDRITLFWVDADNKAHFLDAADYDPNPPEGAILVRRGDRLVPALATV